MSKAVAKTAIIACTGFLLLGSMAGQAEAYTLLDWMRSWPTYYQPAPAAAPAATPPSMPATPAPPVITVPPSAYTPASPAASAPATTCSSPPTTCASPATTSGTTAYSVPTAPARPIRDWFARLFGRRRVVSYRPEVVYRTRLTRVPTTNYRPVTSYDPATASNVTRMQPCTTYSWQFRRVPHVNYRPVYAPAATTGYVPGAYAAPSYSPGATHAPATTTPAAPYYSTPAQQVIPSVPPQQVLPGTSGVSPSAQPTTPADQQPSLSPTELPGVQNGQPVPSIRKYPPTPPLDDIPSKKADEKPKKSAPSTGAKLNLTPVPDPEAPGRRAHTPVAPRLIDPRDRTASRTTRPAWSYSPIVWPEKPAARTSVQPAVVEAPPVEEPKKPELDSGGWRAVRP